MNSGPGQVDRQLLGAALRRHRARRERPRAPHPQLVGHALHGLLQRVLAARQHQLGAEHREPQALGLAVDVAVGAQLLLLEEAAQVDRARRLVRVLVVERVALQVLAEAQLGGASAVLVLVGVAGDGAASARRADLEPEVEVEQPVEGRDVLGALDQRRAQACRARPRGRRGPPAQGARARRGPRPARRAAGARAAAGRSRRSGAPLSARDRGRVRDRGDDGGASGRASGRRCARSPGAPSSRRGRT